MCYCHGSGKCLNFGLEQDYTIYSHPYFQKENMAHCNAAVVVHFTHLIDKNVKHFFSLHKVYKITLADLSAITALLWRNLTF